MIVNKESPSTKGTNPPFGYEIIGRRNGFCDKGFHYGNGCFDRIVTWFIYKKESECGSKA